MTVSAIANPGRIQSAIARAAQATGVDFDYLLGQAKIESGFNANARAASSSASGLYQFIESSWLAVVKKHGAEHGLGWAANAISTAGGRPSVADGATRQAILALRNDPEVASLMAAEHASDNADALETSLGREATGTDLYMAHFLGLGGARKFLRAMASDGDRAAAGLFPAAARANRNVFFQKDGSARSLSEVYQRFAAKLGNGADAATTNVDGATVVAGAGESDASARAWASTTLGRFKASEPVRGSLLRPTPDNARLAYMMLASMGN